VQDQKPQMSVSLLICILREHSVHIVQCRYRSTECGFKSMCDIVKFSSCKELGLLHRVHTDPGKSWN